MLLVLSSSASAFQPNEFSESSHAYVETLLHASSAPVSINEFLNDWQGSFKKGDYAFADGRLRTGVNYQSWEVAVEKRWHYDLRFSPDTAQLYYNIENKAPDERQYQLGLTAKILHAEGVSFTKLFNYKQFKIKPIVTLYRSDFYQIGKITGVASGDIANKDNIAVNVNIEDYHFSEDKLLTDPSSGGQGKGVSFDLAIQYENERWLFSAVSQDLYNHWQFNNAVFLNGNVCLTLAGGAGDCVGSGGYYGNENYSLNLSSSFNTEVTYKPYALSVNSFTHGRYQRLGVQKDWSTAYGRVGAAVYSTKQLGLHWQSQWHRVGLVLDQPNWKKARHAQIDFAITVPW